MDPGSTPTPGQSTPWTRWSRRASLLEAALLVGLVLTAAFSVSVAHAAFPGRNGVLSVSYGFRHCPSYRVATLQADGKQLRMLTPPGDCSAGKTIGRTSWAPDGRQLIFDYELPAGQATNADYVHFAVMNADGSARRDVPLSPAPPLGNLAPAGLSDVGAFARSDPTFTVGGTRLIYTRTLWKPSSYPSEIWSATV